MIDWIEINKCLDKMDELAHQSELLDTFVNEIVPVSGVPEKCKNIDIVRGAIIESGRQIRVMKCHTHLRGLFSHYKSMDSDNYERMKEERYK